MAADATPSEAARARGSQPLSFARFLEDAAELAAVSLGENLDIGEEYRALYDCWVKAGGYLRGKPRRSVRRMKEWLGRGREVRSLETKLAGKTLLQRDDVEYTLDLFLERWQYDSKEDKDYPYSEQGRDVLVDSLAAEVMVKAGGPFKLPLRSRNGKSLAKPKEPTERKPNSPRDDGELAREALLKYYRDHDAFITVSSQRTFVSAEPGVGLALFHRLMDNFRRVDESDDRFRTLIWIVDLGRRESDVSAQAAFQNLDFVATQFRSLLITRHPDKEKRRKWFRERVVVLVGTLDVDEIDAIYAEAGLKPQLPEGDKRSWITPDRLLFEGIPHQWVDAIAKRAIDTMAQRAITVHCNRKQRQEFGFEGDKGEDIDFYLSFSGKR